MNEEVLKDFLEIPQVVEIINKYGLSSTADIKKMLNMAQGNVIRVDVVNKIAIS